MTGDPVEVALLACADLLPRGASVLAACSGGPDSAALTAELAACADALGVRVAVGHVDHALRPESAGDAEQVRDLARSLGLPFHLRRLEALDVSELGLEGAAREARYGALAQLAAQAGADRVATAHTRRDQAETVLLRLARGGGSGAVAGIRRKRALTEGILLVRPLLGVTREATEAYCRARGLRAVEDAHNADPRRARARLRAVMPALAAALNPRLEEALAGAARIAAEEDVLLDGLAREALDSATAGEGFSAERLAAVPTALLRRALLMAAQGSARPERGHLEQLVHFLTGRRTGRLDLPGGRAVIERGVLRFESNAALPPPPVDVAVPGPGVYRWAGRALHVGAGAQRADLRLAPFPWTLRKRLPGDRFRVAGGPEKKLGDVWQAEGVPASRRERIPLLADAGGRVFWVEGLPPGPACAAPPEDAVRFEFAPEMDALR
ncbi:MAG TPA: tRNA lysidine(34) synthetase TilS [Myxococcales bacterium]|nr:tRNA lysidine(34) synthetase TilS [Myxococcales bacterium]